MNGFTWFVALLASVLVFWGVGVYNRIMRLRNKIGEAYALLDLHLSTRSRVIQQLLDLVRPELVNEQATLDALQSAQSECDAAAAAVRVKPVAGEQVTQLAVSAALHAAALTRLLALLDQHPELLSRPDVQPLLEELKLTENQRLFARQLFHETVRVYNEALDQFPTRVVVSILGFKEAHTL